MDVKPVQNSFVLPSAFPPRSLRIARRKPKRVSRVLPILLAGVICWFGGEFLNELAKSVAPFHWFGRHAGISVEVSAVGVIVSVGSGWPTAAWEEDRGRDGGDGGPEIGHECFGFLLGLRGTDYNGTRPTLVRWYLFGIPWWFVVALLAAPYLERAARRRRAAQLNRKRATRGICRRCGYDLRATPRRCPECGTVA